MLTQYIITVLVKKQIERLQAPALQCVDAVFAELKRVASHCEQMVPQLQQFPVLKKKLITVVKELLLRRVLPTKQMVTNLINIEMSYCNTNHPDFVGGSKAVSGLMERVDRGGYDRNTPNKRTPAHSRAPSSVPDDTSNGNGGANLTHQGIEDGVVRNRERESKSGLFERMFHTAHKNQNSNISPASAVATGGDTDGKKDSSGISGGNGSAGTSPPPPRPPPPPVAAYQSQQQQQPPHPPPHQQQSSYHRSGFGGLGVGVGVGVHAGVNAGIQKHPSERELIETEIIKSLIYSYFNIVKRNIQDAVPKAIMFFLVNHSRNNLQTELVSTLYKEDMFDDLLQEDPDVAEKRKACLQMLNILHRALDIVNQIRDHHI